MAKHDVRNGHGFVVCAAAESDGLWGSGDDTRALCTIDHVDRDSNGQTVGPCGNNADTCVTVRFQRRCGVRWHDDASYCRPIEVSALPDGMNGFRLAVRGDAEAAMLLLSLRRALAEVTIKIDGRYPELPEESPAPPPGDSPIERAFAVAYKALTGSYPPNQIQIGGHRVDFCIGKLVVECDGHEYHSSKEQRASDARRDRVLMAAGFKVVRFTGSEIHASAKACALEALELSK